VKITFLGVAVLVAVALIVYALWKPKALSGEENHAL
jgi:hypothetical protein